MDNWDDVLNDQAPGGVGGDAAKPADDGVLVASSKFAAKCRSCSKTIDVGAPAWFQRSGEPGRKTTCVECHDAAVAAAAPADGAAVDPDAPAQKKRKVSTRRKPVTKLTPEMLLDPRRGIVAVYREFSALKVKSGSKHAPAELRRVLAKYAEWAHALLPDVEFGQFVEKLDKVSQRPVLHRLAFLRDVQQGVASLDDLAMEEEAEGVDSSGRAVRVDEYGLPVDDDVAHGGGDDDDDDWRTADGTALRAPPAAPSGAAALTGEQAARAEANRRAALERAAARRAEAARGGAGGGGAEAARAAAGGGAAAGCGGGGGGAAMEEEEFPDADDFPDAEDDFDDDAMAAELGIDDFDDVEATRPPAAGPAAGRAGGGEAGEEATVRYAAQSEAQSEAQSGPSSAEACRDGSATQDYLGEGVQEGETQDYGAEDGGVEDGDDGADALSALDESAQAAAAQRAQALAEALALDEEGL